MDDIELCPPWMSEIVWWLINHPPHHVPIQDKERLVEATETLLVALQGFHYAHVYAVGPKHDETLRLQLQEAAVQQMTMAVQQLSEFSNA